jgi:hypothetical protein
MLDGERLFFSHMHLHGGPAPVRRYLPELIELVLNGKIEPDKVFDLTLPLDGVAKATAQWTNAGRSRRFCARMERVRKSTMSTSQKYELSRIIETHDLHISPFREGGKTSVTPTWIWSVAVDDGVFVPAYNGKGSRWYKAAMRQGAVRITAAGMTKNVTFEPVTAISTILSMTLIERSTIAALIAQRQSEWCRVKATLEIRGEHERINDGELCFEKAGFDCARANGEPVCRRK